MSNPKKINMSAITETQDITESKTEIVKKESESKIPHISLGSIKTNKSVETKKEIKDDKDENKHDNKRNELLKVLNKKIEPVKTEPIIEQAVSEVVVTDKITEVENNKKVEEIDKVINKEVEEETNKKFKIESNKSEEDKKNEKKELFGNYKTDYKEKTIFEKIKEDKKLIKLKLKQPKTRIFLVASLLILLISIIGGLFIFDPDNHSIEIYKTRITSNINNIKIKYIDKPWVPTTINIETITFNIETRENLLKIILSDSKPNYKYNQIIYKTKNELETVLKKEVKIKKEAIDRKEAEIARQEAERKRIETKEKDEIEIAEKEKKSKIIVRNVLIEKFR